MKNKTPSKKKFEKWFNLCEDRMANFTAKQIAGSAFYAGYLAGMCHPRPKRKGKKMDHWLASKLRNAP